MPLIAIVDPALFGIMVDGLECIGDVSDSYESRGDGLAFPGRPANQKDIHNMVLNVIQLAEKIEGATVLVLQKLDRGGFSASCSESVVLCGKVYKIKKPSANK